MREGESFSSDGRYKTLKNERKFLENLIDLDKFKAIKCTKNDKILEKSFDFKIILT